MIFTEKQANSLSDMLQTLWKLKLCPAGDYIIDIEKGQYQEKFYAVDVPCEEEYYDED